MSARERLSDGHDIWAHARMLLRPARSSAVKARRDLVEDEQNPLLVAQLIFYVVVVIHAAVSFSNAWVTLGILGDMDKKKLMDKVVYIFFTLLLLVTAISSITGAVNLFVIKEG